MKDYRLSEILSHCKKMREKYGYYPIEACLGCHDENVELYNFCSQNFKAVNFLYCEEDIEPRDMIELPYKENNKSSLPYVEYYNVFYRGNNGKVRCATFETSDDADAFLKELKG